MSDDLTAIGRDILRQEAGAVAALADDLGDEFAAAAQVLLECQGRVIVTGIGKSGAIARKAASTLASTGTPALFLHPAEGVHGDLGMVTPQDVVIALSHSGESDEMRAILPVLRHLGVPIVAVTGRGDSTLAGAASVVLPVRIEREACPHDLAPTTSTTCALALMDALALAVMQARGFGREDYAVYHPAGAIGRRLLLRVRDLMRRGDQLAVAPPDTPLLDAMFRITSARAGSVFAVDRDGRLLGLIADGDIRRLLLNDRAALDRPIGDSLNEAPRTTSPDALITEAAALMNQDPPIGELPVLDEERRPVGVLNLKDIVREKLY